MIIRPKLLVSAITKILGSESWLNWEPETLKFELDHAKDPTFKNKYDTHEHFTNVVDASRALLANPDNILDEWHLFENVCVAFSGGIPNFYETTPVEAGEMIIALRLIKDLLPSFEKETSDEVKMYIGSLFFDKGILYHLNPFVNKCIAFTLKKANIDVGDSTSFQQKILLQLCKNKKFIKQMSDAVVNGAAAIDLPDNLDVSVIKAIQCLLSYMVAESIAKQDKKIIKEFLASDKQKTLPPVVQDLDAERASVSAEHIVAVPIDDLEDMLAQANTDPEFHYEVIPDLSDVDNAILDAKKKLNDLTNVKKSSSNSGVSRYVSGRIYKITNEAGYDDVPKSKLLGLTSANNIGDVIDRGGSSSFSRKSKNLKVLDDNGNIIENNSPGEDITAPSDSSLILAGF